MLVFLINIRKPVPTLFFNNFTNKEIYMYSDLVHNQHPITYASVLRDIQSHSNIQKYLVVDSENEEQSNCTSQLKFIESTPCSVSNFQSSVIIKPRGQSLSNFMSQQSLNKHSYVDLEIKKAEREVSRIQQECKLLESIINDMAVEQAKILVDFRTKQRKFIAENTAKLVTNQRICPIHSQNNQNLEKDKARTKQLDQPVLLQQIKFTTPVFTVNFEGGREIKYTDEAKTINLPRGPLKAHQNKIKAQDKLLVEKRKISTVKSALKSKQNGRNPKVAKN